MSVAPCACGITFFRGGEGSVSDKSFVKKNVESSRNYSCCPNGEKSLFWWEFGCNITATFPKG